MPFGSGLKVLSQYGSHSLISNVMRLTCNGVALRIGQYMGHRIRSLAQPRGRPAVDDQGWGRDFCQSLFWQLEVAVAHEDGIVDERRCKCLLSGPERRLSHGSHEFGRHPHSLRQEEFDHVAFAPLTQQLSKLFFVVLRYGRPADFQDVWGLSHREILHFWSD